MDIYNGRNVIEFSDVIKYLEEFSDKIAELEENDELAEKTIEQLENKLLDKDYEIERLQKLLDENGIDYWQN